jgi:hypothetical protein
MLRCFGVLVAFSAASLYAGSDVATVTSGDPFSLNGATMPVQGISSWPVVAGDEISASAGAATVSFAAGSKVTLAKGAKARIETRGKKKVVRLVEGTGWYSAPASSELLLYAANQPQNVAPGTQGTFAVGSQSSGSSSSAAVQPSVRIETAQGIISRH